MTFTHVQQIVTGGTFLADGTFTVSGLSGINSGDLVCIMVQWGSSSGSNVIPTTVSYSFSGDTEIDRRDSISVCPGRTTAAYGFAAGGETSLTITGSLPETNLRGGVTIAIDVFRGFAGAVTVRDFDHQVSAGDTGTIPAVTPSASVETVLWAPFTLNPNYSPTTVTSGWTLGTLFDQDPRWKVGSAYRIVSSPSGDYGATLGGSIGGETTWTAFNVAFDASTPPPPPPDPVPGVVIDPTAVDPIPIDEDIISWRITRGASAEITGGAQPGTLTLLVKNSIAAGADSDNKYNPENGSSPLIAYLRDGTALWVGINSDGKLAGTDPRGLFGGRITDITPIPVAGADAAPTVEIVAEDALGWMSRVPVQFGYTAGRAQDELRAAILAAADETRTDLDHEITTMPLSAAEGDALALLEELNKSNGTRHYAKPADSSADWYTYVTRNRQWRLDGTSDYTLSQLSNHVTSTSGWRLSADTVINQQRATITPITFTPSTFAVWTSDALPLLVTTTRSFDVWVDFDDYVSAPVVNSSSSGATPTITITSFGTRAHLTIAVSSGTCTFTHLSIDGALARRLPNQSWVADDLTSQVLPRGVRAGSDITSEYVGTLESARGIAEHVVWRYAQPQVRPTVTIENWFPYMFDVQMYDIVSYTSPQLGVTSRHFEVVGQTHTSDVAASSVQHHTLELVLQECFVQEDPGWFTWDVSVWNGSDVLGY